MRQKLTPRQEEILRMLGFAGSELRKCPSGAIEMAVHPKNIRKVTRRYVTRGGTWMVEIRKDDFEELILHQFIEIENYRWGYYKDTKKGKQYLRELK